MNFSQFLKRIYGNLSGISSQGQFIGALFTAAGSNYFPSSPASGSDDYQKKIFSGQRILSQNLKNSFPRPINLEKLSSFFQSRIGANSLHEIMNNFGIPNDKPQNKKLFIMALCIQFNNFILEVSNEIDDIVSFEYNRLLQESNTIVTSKSVYYPGDNLQIVKQVPELEHRVNFYDDFEHTWVVKNTGTVTWNDRYIECTQKSRVKVKNEIINLPLVKPGQEVYLKAEFNARGFEGKFDVLWEMKNSEGIPCFDDKKQFRLIVIVENQK